MPRSKTTHSAAWLAAILLGAVLVGSGVAWLASDYKAQRQGAQQQATAEAPPSQPQDPATEPLFPLPPPVAPPGDPRPPILKRDPDVSYGRAAGLHRTKDPLGLTASSALVIDQRTGEVLYQKNSQVALPIASLTKLMTGIIITEAQLPMDEEITITEADVDRKRNSRSRLRVGTTLSRAEALRLSLMSSENRAAHALGRTFPGGMSAFVEAMNRKARQLGMRDTRFVDPTGLSEDNQSTARDLALLTGEAAKKPLLRNYSTTDHYLAEFDGRRLQYLNSNRLVRGDSWDIFLQKTGYIIEAGQCLAMVTRLAGHNVVMVLLDAGSKADRSADAERIRRWVAKQTAAESGTLAETDEDAGEQASTSTSAAPARTRFAKKAGDTPAARRKAGGDTSPAVAKAPRDKPQRAAKAVAQRDGRVRASFTATGPSGSR